MRQQPVGVGEPAVRERELRVLAERLLEELDRLLQPFGGALVEVIAALEIQVARREVVAALARAGRELAVRGHRGELGDDRLGDLLLRRDRIGRGHVGGLRPEVAAAGAVHELGGHAQSVAARAHAAADEERGIAARRGGAAVVGRRLAFGREHAQRLERQQAVHDLVAQATAELRERRALRAIGEGLHRDGVASRERGRERRPERGGALAGAEDGRVAALRQVDDLLVALTLFAVVAREPRAQPPRLHPHDRVGARIERRFLPEDLDADHVLLEVAAAAVERLEDDEAAGSASGDRPARTFCSPGCGRAAVWRAVPAVWLAAGPPVSRPWGDYRPDRRREVIPVLTTIPVCIECQHAKCGS